MTHERVRMYSRKIAFSLAKQYRRCPPPSIMEDRSQQKAWKNHLALCPYCAGRDREPLADWDRLARAIKRVDSSVKETFPEGADAVRPGQLRFARTGPGVWRGNYFHTPPLVLVMRKPEAPEGGVMVAQTYHDIQMAAPGDLIVTADDAPPGPLFVECWNIYTLDEALLGPSVAAVPERVMEAALKCENQPGFCPQWAVLPRPLTENDPRIFFRELEREVARAFSSRPVVRPTAPFLTPRLEKMFGSPARLQEIMRAAAPGTGWKRAPRSFEEAFAMAALPVECLPLAAADGSADPQTANLVRMEAGKVASITPVPVEILGQSGGLTVSGRVRDLPGDLRGSRFICFLEPEGRSPVPPAGHEWKEETGDFIIDFEAPQDTAWRLKAAVVFEPEAEPNEQPGF